MCDTASCQKLLITDDSKRYRWIECGKDSINFDGQLNILENLCWIPTHVIDFYCGRQNTINPYHEFYFIFGNISFQN